jgi:DNA-binding PadR family transcriptional regulator
MFRGRHEHEEHWHWQRRFGPPDILFRFGPRRRGPFRAPWGGPPPPFDDDPFGERGGAPRRQRRGDIKYALLELLAERPRHGYELIKALEERYAGFYRPSPGSVYPTLQMLEEEGYLTSEQLEGKRVYNVTEAGHEFLRARPHEEQPAGHPRHPQGGPGLHALREEVGALLATVMELARHGRPDQLDAAMRQLEATRRELYSILARGDAEPPQAG